MIDWTMHELHENSNLKSYGLSMVLSSLLKEPQCWPTKNGPQIKIRTVLNELNHFYDSFSSFSLSVIFWSRKKTWSRFCCLCRRRRHTVTTFAVSPHMFKCTYAILSVVMCFYDHWGLFWSFFTWVQLILLLLFTTAHDHFFCISFGTIWKISPIRIDTHTHRHRHKA